MSVQVLYFAASRDATGTPQESIKLSDVTTSTTTNRSTTTTTQIPLDDLLLYMHRRHPGLKKLLETAMIAINMEYVQRESGWLELDSNASSRETVWVKEGDEVAVIPPVSGG
ncbi:hypothetical protein HDV05_008564 [Chytridiales sp. JEL 0842]|nr:hypothetical protein HDV05_008564 [Chytridiales sp. JEL 0842]